MFNLTLRDIILGHQLNRLKRQIGANMRQTWLENWPRAWVRQTSAERDITANRAYRRVLRLRRRVRGAFMNEFASNSSPNLFY